jgi:hypothetical protein
MKMASIGRRVDAKLQELAAIIANAWEEGFRKAKGWS